MYDSVHQAFIQAMMCRKIVLWSEAADLLGNLAKNFSERPEEYQLQAVIDEINGRVRDLKMQLRDVTCEVTGKRYCTLVVTVETYVSRLSSKYTPNELQLFQKILDEIVTSNNGHILMNTCINLSNSLPEDMTKSNAEGVIRRFLADKWFIQGDKGLIYLGARCISELEPVIRDMYKDYIGECPLCQQLAIVGKKCNSCFCRTHFHCLRNYKARSESVNTNICLKCGNDPEDFSETFQKFTI
ncbi:non-structural maintenance of chromosomes element 1 homolog [Ischnura elegans]|uniref:non-structural maintenance of chromosomes element 1 homolog n=1 Tax=Ischnura elegans TaxID=197161 RepID=UPI001ED88168|nr:non-structural maintenance of chromosomes element 1 homolog [Ischnura elegans]XP_046393816.1 non-structural maintenance of chromosomes element 1 homolog [Ischnura elegans]